MTSTYNPTIKTFYCPTEQDTTSDYRLIPAPDISISVQMNYSNDIIIGYTYNINLTGVITALDMRDGNDNRTGHYGTGAVADHIHIVRKILSQNGNMLQIVNAEDDSIIFRAKGGILRSLSFSESDNNWYHYAKYEASIEFSTVDFAGSTEDCSDIFINSSSYSSDSGTVDISQFKIKSFQDSWNFTFDETESYIRNQITDLNQTLAINNNSFNIEYSISATGKHHYIDDGANKKLLPAWEQAKNFVQYRLYNQVTNLINNILSNKGTACSPTGSLSQMNIPGSGGLLSSLGGSSYAIYNEQITCEASESEGSFSATYSAIVKSKLGNLTYSSIDAKHTISKSIKKNRNNNATDTNISIQGTIEGLLLGGLIRSPIPFSLPNSGSFLIFNGDTANRYIAAKAVLDKIYSDTDYSSGIGANGKRDLKAGYKSILGINATELGRTAGSDDPRSDPPHPISFNLTHDYNNGIINYTVEYSSNSSCGRKYREISIQNNRPTKVIATFNIPNSDSCPTIQELGTYTAATVSVTVQGVDLTDTGQPEEINLLNEVAYAACDEELYFPVSLPTIDNMIMTQKQYTKNPVDGSFTLNLGYVCGTEGCPL